jgi:hypothetical protein
MILIAESGCAVVKSQSHLGNVGYYHLKTICKWVDIEIEQKPSKMTRALERALRQINRHFKHLDRVALAHQNIILPKRYKFEIHDTKGVRFVAVPEGRVRLIKRDLAHLEKRYPEAM